MHIHDMYDDQVIHIINKNTCMKNIHGYYTYSTHVILINLHIYISPNNANTIRI